MQMEITYA